VWTEVKVSVWWPCVLKPSFMSMTKAVTTNTIFLSMFGQALAHSILHVSAGWHLILIGYYRSEGVWSPRQKCLNSSCETWAYPRGHFSLGGDSKTDKHKQQELQFCPMPSGDKPHIKKDPLSVFLWLEWIPFPTGYDRNSLLFVKHNPFPACQRMCWEGVVYNPN